jgi:surface polysaccharide O-acyltransferase-like enzyme
MSSSLVESRIKQKSDGKYDITKFVLSLFVVAIHSQLFPSILYPWLRIAVPLFFVMTSYFLFGKLNKVSEKQERNSIVRNFVKRNLSLYIFWAIVFFPRRLFLTGDVFKESVLKGTWDMVKNFLLGGAFSASWYIMASVVGTIIIFILSKRLNNRTLLVISAVIYIFVVITASYKFAFSRGSAVYHIVTNYSRILGSPVYTFPAGMLWIACGKCFAEKTFKISRKAFVIVSVLSAILLYGEWLFVKHKTGEINNDAYFGLVPLCIGLFGLLESAPPVYFKNSLYLRRCSTFIYVSHSIVISGGSYFCRHVFGWSNSVLLFVMAILVCVCGYLIVEWLLNKYPEKKIVQLLKYSY